MQITADKTIFNIDMETLKKEPIWSVRRSSAEYYMGSSLYMLGMISWRASEDKPWSYYYASRTECHLGTNIPVWYPVNASHLYDNTLVDGVTYAEAEEVYNSQM